MVSLISNPYIIPGSKRTTESERPSIQFEISHHQKLIELSNDVKELKRVMKLLQNPDKKILSKYPSLRDLYDQYREIYILIFKEDLDQ